MTDQAPTASPMAAFRRASLSTYAFFNQGEIWLPKRPADPVRIADMDGTWRFNCAQMLLRDAARHADSYGWGEVCSLGGALLSEDNAMDLTNDMLRWQEERERDPQAWIRKTRLYQALVKGLPSKRRKVARLAEMARHWSDCPARGGCGACSCAAAGQPPREFVPLRTAGRARGSEG